MARKSRGNSRRANDEPVETMDEIIEKYRTAGRIHSQVSKEAKEFVKSGVSITEIADLVEGRTRELGGLPAFPCNLSLNDGAAHYTALPDSDYILDKDIIKVDLGVHIDGYIADGAFTVDLSGEYGDLVKASEDALAAALDTVKAGVSTSVIGGVIEDTIHAADFNPVVNLTGHGVAKYEAHSDPTIPNKRIGKGVELNAGDFIAIEPFVTDGEGFVVDEPRKDIYRLVNPKSTRVPAVRKVLDQIKEYGTLPFAKRWIQSDKLEYALMQLEKSNIIMGYHALREVSGGMVSQSEHTLIVTEDGCEIITL